MRSTIVMLCWSQILLTLIIITFHVFASIISAQANRNEGTSPPLSFDTFKSAGQNDSTDLGPHPNLNPDPEQTKKAIETIHSSNRQDILVWRTELSETQKYFNKLKVQNFNEEKMSGTEDPVFRQWADKTEERMSMLFGAMATRLSLLDSETTTTT